MGTFGEEEKGGKGKKRKKKKIKVKWCGDFDFVYLKNQKSYCPSKSIGCCKFKSKDSFLWRMSEDGVISIIFLCEEYLTKKDI